jgi:hypothetical protein
MPPSVALSRLPKEDAQAIKKRCSQRARRLFPKRCCTNGTKWACQTAGEAQTADEEKIGRGRIARPAEGLSTSARISRPLPPQCIGTLTGRNAEASCPAIRDALATLPRARPKEPAMTSMCLKQDQFLRRSRRPGATGARRHSTSRSAEGCPRGRRRAGDGLDARSRLRSASAARRRDAGGIRARMTRLIALERYRHADHRHQHEARRREHPEPSAIGRPRPADRFRRNVFAHAPAREVDHNRALNAVESSRFPRAGSNSAALAGPGCAVASRGTARGLTAPIPGKKLSASNPLAKVTAGRRDAPLQRITV